MKNYYHQTTLSIWDMTCLWCEKDPVNTTVITEDMQKIFLTISNGIENTDIEIQNEEQEKTYVTKLIYGETEYYKRHYPSYIKYTEDGGLDYSALPRDAFDKWCEYGDFSQERLKQYWKIAEPVYKTCKNYIFEKNILKKVFINAGDLYHFFNDYNIELELPSFWFGESEISAYNKKIKKQNKNIDNKIIINLDTCTDLFKTMLEVKKDIFDKEYTEKLEFIILDVKDKYNLSKNEATYICKILHKNKKGGIKK
jgi:hypothetical protein